MIVNGNNIGNNIFPTESFGSFSFDPFSPEAMYKMYGVESPQFKQVMGNYFNNAQNSLNSSSIIKNPFNEEQVNPTINNSPISGIKDMGPIGSAVFGAAKFIEGAYDNIERRKKEKALNNIMNFNKDLMQAQKNLDILNANNNQTSELFSRYAALGGPLQTHGSDWSNGITEINAGSTHEQNPLGGVMMGIAPDGEPNFVEEGEVVWNGYVFSNRIKVPKRVIKEYKLKGSDDMTFADAVKKAQEESEERPNDPISKRGLTDIMSKLMVEQELIRQKKEMNKQNKEEREQNDILSSIFAEGGKISIKPSKRGTFTAAAKKHGKSVQEFASQVLSNPDNYSSAMVKKANFARNASKWKHAYGGHLFDGYSEPTQQMLNPYAFSKNWDGFNYYNPRTKTYDEGYLNFVNSINQDWIDRIMSGTYGNMNRYLATNSGIIPSIESVKRLATDHKYSDMHKVVGAAYEDYLKNDPFESYRLTALEPNIEPDILTKTINAGPVTPTGKASDLSNSNTIFDTHFNNEILGRGKGRRSVNDKRNLLTYLRYAPILGSAISLFRKKRPDYSAADYLESAINSNMRDIDYMPIGDYMAYNPLDRLFYANQLGAQAGATRRNILNTSNANRGTAIAGMLASDYSAQENLGKLYRQAEEYNLDQRHKVADFNQKTNMFNAENYLKKEMANQDNAKARVGYLAHVADLRDRANNMVASAKSVDLTNLLQGLGDIGREEVEAAWINKNPAYYYMADRFGRGIPYKFNPYTREALTGKNGGFLTIKNKRRSK